MATAKTVTSADVFSGMFHAVRQVIGDIEVIAVMVGTTHFVNALLQRQGLAKVCTLRLCGPATRAIPPMANWPQDLKNAVKDNTGLVLSGGFEIYFLGKWFNSICLWWFFP